MGVCYSSQQNMAVPLVYQDDSITTFMLGARVTKEDQDNVTVAGWQMGKADRRAPQPCKLCILC